MLPPDDDSHHPDYSDGQDHPSRPEEARTGSVVLYGERAWVRGVPTIRPMYLSSCKHSSRIRIALQAF
jgi:hypothetical protein